MSSSIKEQYDIQFQRDNDLDRVDTILRESPPALRDKITRIRDFIHDEWHRSIAGRYQVAVIVREIYDDVHENKGTKYGAKAVEAIMKAFRWDKTSVHQALNVAQAFTPDEIEDIATKRLPSGQPVTFSHVVALASADDEKQRRTLLNKVVNAGWTARKLANAVTIANAKPGKEEKRGRPLAKPRNFDAVLDQQGHFIEDFLKRNKDVWTDVSHSLLARADDLALEDITQERIDKLKRHVVQMNTLADKAKERANETIYVCETLQRRYQRRPGQTIRLLEATVATPTNQAIEAKGDNDHPLHEEVANQTEAGFVCRA